MNQLKWEKTKDGTLRLLAVDDLSSEVVVPDEIEGLPITEVGPYCFAKNKYLKSVVLPDSIKKIERMAFYHCTSLTQLEIGADIQEISSDIFMNCYNLHELKVRCGANEKSGVRLILRQISHDLRVHFLGQKGLKKEGQEAKLLFTEYYESYDEVAPAHLFGRNIEGEGFRARQFFKDGVFEYKRYDSTFQKACAEEKEETLCEMTMNRLRYPVDLSEEARSSYETYARIHLACICKQNVLQKNAEELAFLCEQQLMEKGALEQAIRYAAETEWAEGSAMLMHLKAQYFTEVKKKRYEFDDF